jgi:hypothetical protein
VSVLELVFSRRRWCCQFTALRPDQHQTPKAEMVMIIKRRTALVVKKSVCLCGHVRELTLSLLPS